MRKLGFALLALMGGMQCANAVEIPPSPIVKTALVVDAAAIKTDVGSWVGVTFTIPEHWHIYWQNPGDSGVPTAVKVTAPKGITAGDVVWPAPERIVTGDIVTYGYRGEMTLPVPLSATRDGAAGPLTVEAKWLVCSESCIPESATLTATLPSHTENAAKILEAAVIRAPQPLLAAESRYDVTGTQVVLRVKAKELAPEHGSAITDLQFYPLENGIVANTSAPEWNTEDGGVALRFIRGTADPVRAWHGVLQVTRGDQSSFYSLEAPAGIIQTAMPNHASEAPAAIATPPSFVLALALAFLGGLILNIMPCVLPILALKALAISKKAEASKQAARRQGVAYTAGVVASFLSIAIVMLVLKASGAAIGWGFQLQEPWFVALLTLLMLAVAANLFGLFTLPVLFGRQAMALDENRRLDSFLTGILAVLVATPCTAPFMATAIGATLSFPALQALLVFAMLGLGMAAPFLVISFWPAARRLLPKPGAWMHRFKQFLALPMLATALWLAWVLVQLTGHASVAMDSKHLAYTPETLTQLRENGTPVLVDTTAAWCLSCKVNERVALKPEAMQRFFHERNVTLMVADWTTNDPAITDYLASFGRNGVPLYVYYPPHGEPVVLPQILTPSIIRKAIAHQ